jgi:hypothetical protein
LLVVGPVARALGRPRLVRLLATAPFLKVAVDAGRGCFADAFVTSAFASERWELGRFRLGLTFSRPLLEVDGILGALAHGRWMALSGGDVVGTFLARRVDPRLPGALAIGVLAVGSALAARRIAVAVAFERARRRRRRSESDLGAERILGREIDVYRAEGPGLVPFTGGLLRPYVAIPRAALEVLSPAEIEAARLHELAHVRALDAPLLFGLELAADLLWFVPGSRLLVRAAADAAERAADLAAVRAGADPGVLASAIARLGIAGSVGSLALGGGRTVARVRALLAPPQVPSRFRAAFAIVAAVLAAEIALASTFLTKL